MKYKYTEQLLENFDIESYIKSNLIKTKIKQSGWLTACCPFHDDNNPSFSINSNHGGWKCYGCQKSGSFISFLKEFHSIEFKEVLKILEEGS